MKAKATSALEFRVIIELTEQEARALEVLPSYGVDEFLQVFYKNLGQHYLKPHEQGLRSLFATTKDAMRTQLGRIDKAREAYKGNEG